MGVHGADFYDCNRRYSHGRVCSRQRKPISRRGKSLTSDSLVLLGNANGIGMGWPLLWRSRRGGSFGVVSIKSGLAKRLRSWQFAAIG